MGDECCCYRDTDGIVVMPLPSRPRHGTAPTGVVLTMTVRGADDG